MLIVMHGVHGGGKSLLSRILSEDYGIKLVLTDAADLYPEVINFRPSFRQMVYSGNGLIGYARALEMAGNGNKVILDFGPRHTIPYVEWFLGDEAEFFRDYIERGAKFLEERASVDILNVFLVIRKDKNKVIERIVKRSREGFIQEEVDEEYLNFIDKSMKRLANRMEEEGHRVLRIPADAPLMEKLSMLVEVLNEESTQ